MAGRAQQDDARCAPRRHARRFAVGLLLLLVGGASVAAAEDPPVLVFAAASLRNAMDGVTAAWQQQSGHRAVVSYAGSNALASQIEHGAPADLYLSADVGWMDYLDQRGYIRRSTRRPLVRNRLVLIAGRGGPPSLSLSAAALPDWDRVLADSRLAVCGPAVPCGKYARAGLTSLGLLPHLQPRLAPAQDVRAVLAYVARGEAPLGIVYASDALTRPALRVLAEFPADSHPPIVYPAAQVAGSRNPHAAELLAFLASDTARSLFERQGFSMNADTSP